MQKVSKLNAKDLFLCDNKPQLTLLQKIQLKLLQYKRSKGTPIAYLTKEKEFYGRKFKVSKKTLIPRPETEQIIDICKSLQETNHSKNNFLDLGTGTGCIGITLLKEIPGSRATLLDVSPQALKIAKQNIHTHQVQSKAFLVQSNLLSEIPKSSKFNCIVTNPPYIPNNQPDLVCKNTKKYEPSLALFAGEDGLDIYRDIFQQIQSKDIKFQYLVGEFGFGQKESLELLLQQNFTGCDYKFFNDLNHIPRIFLLTHNEWN